MAAVEPGEARHLLDGEARLALDDGEQALAQPPPLRVHRLVLALELLDGGGDLRAPLRRRAHAKQREEVLVLVLVVEDPRGIEVAQHRLRRRARLGVAAAFLQVRAQALERRQLLLDAQVAGREHLERLIEQGPGSCAIVFASILMPREPPGAAFGLPG